MKFPKMISRWFCKSKKVNSSEEKTPIDLFIERLEALCNKSFEIANSHRDNGRESGLAFYYYGRLTSCFMGVKTLLYSMEWAGSDEKFAKSYIENVLPSRFPRKDIDMAQRYIKETHMAIRFVLFQNFYSQTEFTYKIIQREKHPEETRPTPFRLMTDKYDIMDVDFTKFINAIRNTIHNNGHYFPKHSMEDFTYTFNGKDFVFEYGKPILSVTMEDIFEIIEFVTEQNRILFESDELASIQFN